MKSRLFHRYAVSCIVLLMVLENTSADPQNRRIDPYLQELLQTTPDNELIDVYVVMRNRLSYGQLRNSTWDLQRKERQRVVVSILKNHSASTQSDVLAYLHTSRSQGMVNNIHVIWAINVIAFNAVPSAIYDLDGNFDEIEKIFYDPQYPEELLIDDEGITNTIERMVCIPIPIVRLPHNLV